MKDSTIVILAIVGVAIVGLFLWFMGSRRALAAQQNTALLQQQLYNSGMNNQLQYGKYITQQDNSLPGIVNNLIDSGTLSDIAGIFGGGSSDGGGDAMAGY
jgi:type II secretory pathway pseudopilin PulG